MKTYINIGGSRYPARVAGYAADPAWGGRATKRITLALTHGEAKEIFVDGAQWSITHERPAYTTQEGETVTPKPIDIDCSAWDMAGAITDNRDGTVTVCMGKSTVKEVLGAVLGEAVSLKRAEQKTLRAAIEAASAGLDDATASAVPLLFPGLKGDGSLVNAGTRINWNGKVKRAAVDLWDTAENTPDKAPDLWEDLPYRDGIRIIPTVITVGLAFSKGEKGWWGDTLYVSKVNANVYTPDEYADNWEVAG